LDSIAAAQNAAATASTNATAALTTASGKNSIFRSASTPSALKEGDIWINWNDENKLYVATAAGTGSWQLSRDATIATAVAKADSALAQAQAAVNTANAAYPAGSFNKSAILQAINIANGGSGTSLNGGLIEANTVSATQIVSDYIYTGFISADKINAGTLQGRNINVTGESIGTGSYDSDSGTYGDISSSSNALTTFYDRTPIGGYSAIRSVGVNAIALISTSSAGVTSSWYPYYDGSGDLGVKHSPTYNTSPYRWRNLRLTGSLMIGGDGYSDTPSTSVADRPITRLYNDGRIFANTLGTGSGSTIVQASGFLRVQTSSSRYKENIQEINKSGYLDLMSMLKPVTYQYKEEFWPEGTRPILAGLIAEDLNEIEAFKTVVNYNDQGLPESIAYDRMSSLLVLALQEIKDSVDLIGQRLDALEA
jgi:hypothetical protein